MVSVQIGEDMRSRYVAFTKGRRTGKCRVVAGLTRTEVEGHQTGGESIEKRIQIFVPVHTSQYLCALWSIAGGDVHLTPHPKPDMLFAWSLDFSSLL